MHEKHQALQAKLDSCLAQIKSIETIKPRSTMFKFYTNCRHAWDLLDREFVECRRRGRVTQKYTELERDFLEQIRSFEQWDIMAKLMY